MADNRAALAAPEVLHRQVHPSWVVDGHPSSQAFIPTPKDGGQLSVSRDSLADAKESYARHVGRGLATAGTWSLDLSEVTSVGLSAHADPVPADDAHALIDFTKLSNSAAAKVGKRLKVFAVARGCTYSPR